MFKQLRRRDDSAMDRILDQVELYISGRSLKDLDVFSKSDPLCILSEYNDSI